jgi:hypothetical protein
VILDRADREGLAALEAAVRAGEPVLLRSGEHAALPADEVVPFCHDVGDPALRTWLPPAARPRPDLRVSVVIPCNRGPAIGTACLEAQDVEVELLVLANGSYTDGVRVPWEGHGRTRMRGVQMATAPWVLCTVDDALPLGAGMVRTLVEALEEGRYEAVYARQLAWPTTDAVTRARLRAWTPPGHGHAPADRLDNVCALYRREALLADPFDDVPIAEDWLWGRRHRVGYVPEAMVAHAHPRRLRSSYARTRDIHRQRILAGEPPCVPDLASLARGLPSTLGADIRGALGELLGQYAAARLVTRR